MSRDATRGDIPALILAVLARQPLHGYAIARTIEAESQQVLAMREGALYPALRNLEGAGFITSSWDTSASGPARKVYTLTADGQRELARRQAEWQRYAGAISGLLGGV